MKIVVFSLCSHSSINLERNDLKDFSVALNMYVIGLCFGISLVFNFG